MDLFETIAKATKPANLKEYTVYYNKPLKKSNSISIKVYAENENQAVKIASKKTLIFEDYLTTIKP